jgi:hypothetical protein
MGTISYYPDPKPQQRPAATLARLSGQVVAMRHVDLETVLETVELLRSLDDQSFLDRYNRVGCCRRGDPDGAEFA